MAAGVISNVVGISREFCCVQKLKSSRVKQFGNAIFGAGDDQAIGRRLVVRSLRLGEIGECPQTLAGIYIEHLDGMVAKRGDEEPFPLHIGAEVIDAAIDIWQLNSACQRQRLLPTNAGHQERQYCKRVFHGSPTFTI
jgi:hypothetical protein